MSSTSPLEISPLFDACSQVTIHVYHLHHERFEKFCKFLWQLRRHIGGINSDEFWEPFLQQLYIYRNSILGAPVAFNDPTLLDRIDISQLKLIASQARISDPHRGEDARLTLEAFSALSKESTNLIGDWLTIKTREISSLSIAIIVNPKHFTLAETWKVQHGGVSHAEILIPDLLLQKRELFDHALFCGRVKWFHPKIVRSPKARHYHGVSVPQLEEAKELDSGILDSRIQPVNIEFSYLEQLPTGRLIDDVPEELSEIDITEIIESLNRRPQNTHSSEDDRIVPGCLCILSGGYRVILNFEDRVFVDALDPERLAGGVDAGDESGIERLSTQSLRPGMYVVLRTERSGDFLIHVANQVMGSSASRARANQQLWKAKLRAEIDQHGLKKTAAALHAKGGRRSVEFNIRNWCSERSIRPESDEDFSAILALVGLSGQKDAIYESSQVIDSAHRRAGFHIRDKLWKRLAESDLRNLFIEGVAHIQLDEGDGGKLSIFKVERIHASTFSIPLRETAKPFRGVDELWHE